MERPVIVVHGGAWHIPALLREAFHEGCRQAAGAGWAVLRSGGTALDAVEVAVRVLEDNPVYDAGLGSHTNLNGEVELDAFIMDGRTLELGGVAAVKRVRNPITLARRIMESNEHAFVVGDGAEAWAQALGVPLCDPAELLGQPGSATIPEDTWTPPGMQLPADTVGAVALDLAGNLAVGTSTGGTPQKRPGRVGDTPLVGCGAYADNAAGAAAATGWGERLMRLVLSKGACDLLAQGWAPQAAAEHLIAQLEQRVGGYGGIIMVDRDGQVGLAHNTPNLSFAVIRAGEEMLSGTEFPGGMDFWDADECR
ncbi:MAG: isoaspartyl peptidase/L-asparaginase [Anaerolineae bacterium]|nr:isoaspartyl peptidase/L-asparaginase [Anaerolineae bacterium]